MLCPGAHSMVVEAAGGRRHTSKVIVPAFDAIDIVLSEEGRLSGMLLGADGAPLAQWGVESLRVQAGASGGSVATSKRLTTTDSTGRFGIRGIRGDRVQARRHATWGAADVSARAPVRSRGEFPGAPIRRYFRVAWIGIGRDARRYWGGDPLERATGAGNGLGRVRHRVGRRIHSIPGLLREGEYRLRFTNGLRVVAPNSFRVHQGDSVDLGTWSNASIEALR